MKKLFLIFTCCLIFANCNDSKLYINQANKDANKLFKNTNLFYEENFVNTILDNYHNAQKQNVKNWDSGYIQECQFFVLLHGLELITKDDALFNIQKVYDKYLNYGSLNNKKNKFAYVVLQYLRGNYEEAKKLADDIYDGNIEYKYEFSETSVTNREIKNIVSGIILEKINPEDFKNTIYEQFTTLSEEEMLEILQVEM